ncbi:MAG: PKD domain-containing protein, partial [Bacteroidetes bacterium]|nr:PKD domain-containing protein [Bacteroidota bacterium]
MISGSAYRVSTCGTDNFDTQITIFKSGDPTALAYNDDACGTQSEIFFYPPFNGDYDILVDEFSCVSNAIPTPIVVELEGVIGSGCPYNNDYWFSVPAPTNPSDTFLTNCINGGEYITMTNMIAGNTYYIATCGNTNFDTEITIYPSGGGIPAAYNNDSCGLQSAIMFTPSVSGDYDILVNENPCGYNPICMNLLVVLVGVGGGGCVADFVFDTDITLTVSFTNFAVSFNPLTYAWDFGDGAGTSTLQTPSYTYGIAGTYQVCLTIDDGFGCTDTYCDSVTVPEVASSCFYTQPQICVVTVDSATQKNQIVWEKEVTGVIASYNIYREGLANQFSLVGNVLYANLSNFLDTTSIPAQQQYTYKISAMDNCGDESPMSSPHSTLHLIMLNDAQGETKINFVWDNYKGVTVLGYNVWRYSALQGNTLLSTIANTMSTFTDISPPPTGNLGYMWELALTSVC